MLPLHKFQPQPTPYGSFIGVDANRPRPKISFDVFQQLALENQEELLAAVGHGPPPSSSSSSSSGPGNSLRNGRSGILRGGSRVGSAAAATGPTPATTAGVIDSGAGPLYYANPNPAAAGALAPGASAQAIAGYPGYPSPSYNNDAHPSSGLPYRRMKMDPNGDIRVDSDLAAQEAAAREYQPQLTGPLVGEQTPSHDITEEYAKADEVYVQKTINLPNTYSHYRKVQGDGNCGWRAIGFSYFEILIQQGSRPMVEAELQRLQELNQYIITVGGYDPFLFEDMVDETLTLLGEIAANIEDRQQAMAILMQKFNDPDVSNGILYHLRLLAASYLKGNAEVYAPFIAEGMGVQEYCRDWLELPGREIENLGMICLVNVLLKPVNFVLEVAVLDRTPGSQVNTYRFPSEAENQDPAGLGPMIYLLYRPDHYDILYRGGIVTQHTEPTVQAVADLRVNRAHIPQRQEMRNTPNLHEFSSLDMSPLSLMPGFSSAPFDSGLDPLPPPSDDVDAYTTPSPESPWVGSPYEDQLQQQAVQSQPPPQLRQIQPRPMPNATSAPPQGPSSGVLPEAAGGNMMESQLLEAMRWSEWCHPSKVPRDTWREPAFLTPTFKNSHFNTAHYNNPNFQPEEYKPRNR